jgi:starch-binding outer membrane protein, SusD/RagB family
MKKFLIYIIFPLIVLLAGSACQKHFLDNAPLTQYSDANVWQDSSLITRFVDNIYGNIISNYDFIAYTGLLASITDESKVNNPGSYITDNLVNTGQYTAASNIFDSYWAGSSTPAGVYMNVRNCNLFLAHLGTMPLSAATKNQLTGEVRFLRAYNYQFLYSLFGPFPIIDTVLGIGNNGLYSQRASNDSCIAFILADYNAAAAVLPQQYFAPQDIGRATQGAALGMECRLLLNQKRYSDAAAAAQAVMNLGIYSLFPDYEGMFYPQNDDNSEVIFNKEYGGDLSGQVNNVDLSENTSFFSGYFGLQDCPTQNLVDQYEMTDGLPYTQSPLYDSTHPYANRDPRLAASILYDSSFWLGNVMDMTAGSFYNPIGDETSTGYMLRKFLNPNYLFYGNNTNYQNCIILRLAEIYLDYAECELQLGNAEEARTYVNLLRERPGVNMPDIATGQMTWDAYVRERTVELAFEGERFEDIRRWGMGPQLIGAAIYGMEVTHVGNVHQYQRVLVQQRYFDPKMYLFPIPLAELTKYPAGQVLTQNPGWN